MDQCHKLIIEAYNHTGGIEAAKAIIDRPPDDDPPLPSPSNITPRWCKCGECRPMPTANENKCCRQWPCVSLSYSFQNLVVSRKSLSVAIVSRSDIYADRSDFTNQGMRFAAYRQYVLWQNGYLGRGNHRVVPSCATWAIRDKYPSPDGVYTDTEGTVDSLFKHLLL